MRIISGIRRGHKLFEFEGEDVRPTTDRVKESVFNIIQTFIPDAVCLDMFAGSGALSFEAISRGAKKAVCLSILQGFSAHVYNLLSPDNNRESPPKHLLHSM